MPLFKYAAKNNAGSNVEGVLEASDMMTAAEMLRREGVIPTALQVAEEETNQALAAAVVPAEAAPTLQLPVPAAKARGMLLAEPEPEDIETTSKLEPWQRGGPIAQPAAAAALPAVQFSPPPSAPAAYAAGREAAPFGEGYKPAPTLGGRFKEALVYPILSGVVLKELVTYYRQFATLIRAGLPLYQCLASLEGETRNQRLKQVTRASISQVQAGGKLSEVMAAYPWVFPSMHTQIVRASEQAGTLDQGLKQIADYVEHDLAIRRLLIAETFYPVLVLIAALMLLGGHFFIDGMPAISKLVLGGMGKSSYGVSDYLKDTIGFGLLLLIPCAALFVLFRLFLFNIKGVREAYDTIKTSIPVLGGIVKGFALARFLLIFATLYRSGFTMSSALQIAGEASGNVLLRNAANKAVGHAERGGLVSDALAGSGFFPHMAVNMIRTGETSGNMDEMLAKASEHYEEDCKVKSRQAALIFAVCVLLLVGIMVAMAVIKFYSGYASGISAAGG